MGYVLRAAQPYAEIVERVVVFAGAVSMQLSELALGLSTTDLEYVDQFAALGLDYEEVVHGKRGRAGPIRAWLAGRLQR